VGAVLAAQAHTHAPRPAPLIPQSEIPFGAMTISRLNRGIHKDSEGWPKPKRIGNRNYYNAEEFWAWFNARHDATSEAKEAA
jgi:hypothetical protein